jgi:hypothetical protein
MKKAILFILMLIAGLVIGGKFDQDTKDLEQQEINSTK